MEKIIYTKYNKLRRPEFRISTMICEKDGKRFVIKKALTQEAKVQMKAIYENSLRIGAIYPQLSILIPKYEENQVTFDYLTGQNLEQSLLEQLTDFEQIKKSITAGLDLVTSVADKYHTSFKVTDEYLRVFGDSAAEEGLPAATVTNIDVLFDNIIIKDGKYICLDCEWVFDFPVPVDFIKYRCLFYFYQKYEAYLKKHADLTEFMGCFGITEEHKDIFMEMERNFQMYVTGKDFLHDYVYKYEKANQTMDEAFMNRKEAEGRICGLEDELSQTNAKLSDCRAELKGKYDHVAHLEGIVVDKSHEVDRLNKELALKEQHIQNLNKYIEQLKSSKWYKAQNKVSQAKKKITGK